MQPHLDQKLCFNTVYPGDGCYFFSKHKGSSYNILKADTDLGFTKDFALITIKEIKNKPEGTYNTKGVLKWINDDNPDPKRRSAFLGDGTDAIRLTFWNEHWFSLSEDKVYVCNVM